MIKKSHIFVLLFLSSGIQQSMYGMQDTQALIEAIEDIDTAIPYAMGEEQYNRLVERIDLVPFFKSNPILKDLFLNHFSLRTDADKKNLRESAASTLYPDNTFFRKYFMVFYDPKKLYVLDQDQRNDFFNDFFDKGNRVYKISAKTLKTFIKQRQEEAQAISDALTLSMITNKVTTDNYVPRGDSSLLLGNDPTLNSPYTDTLFIE